MKLSFKFFCIAYIIVLLSTGLGGMFLIKNVTDTLWNSQVERVNTAKSYAADSFLAFSDVSYGKITGAQKISITRQIKNALDSTVTDFEILTQETVKNEYTKLKDSEGLSQFVKKDNLLIMEAVCRLNVGTDVYYLAVYSDFTAAQRQCKRFWNGYGIVVLSLAIVSGLLLYALAKRVTRPLNKLTKAVDDIACGSYGETVNIKSRDYEIRGLSDSFNSMSVIIEQKIKEIKEESEKRSMFVADFTHELKTPMTAIIGYAQMLNSYELNPAERQEAVVAIYNEGKRLEKLSMQLLDLYVLQNERIEMEEVNLDFISEQLNVTLKFLSEKYDVLFSVNFGSETVSANTVLLLSLLYNLADNAFKASEPKSAVNIYSKSKSESVRIFVEDTGRGIAPENIKLLTEPFYREDKARSRRLGGAGLGLSLCKEIASLHSTKLCFESEKGKGTTVSFELKKGGEGNE